MKKHKLFLLIVVLTLSACANPFTKGFTSFSGSGSGAGSGSGSGSGSGASDVGLGLFVRGEGFGVPRLEIKSVSGGTVQLAPGRVHGLIIENGNQVRQPLTCNNGTLNNILYVNVPAFTAGGSITFTCFSGSQNFSIYVGYAGGSKTALVAEKVAATSQSAGTDFAAPAVSNDGHYLFYSVAGAVHSGISGNQVVRLDTQTGVKHLVSSNASGAAGNGDSSCPSVSSDGRYVAFLSSATNLITGISGSQIYRKDLNTEEIKLVSTPDGTVGAVGPINCPSISGAGNRVVFHGTPSNFGAGVLTSQQVFKRDLDAATTVLLSASSGAPASGDSTDPTISTDGNSVTFTSYATLVSGVAAMGLAQVYRAQLTTSPATLSMVTMVSGAAASGDSFNKGVSSDGSYVFISTQALQYTGMTPGPQIHRIKVADASHALVNGDFAGNPGTSPNDAFGGASADGNLVSLVLQSPNLLAGQGTIKVARRNMSANTLTLIKGLSDFDLPPAPPSVAPPTVAALSGDGNTVAFTTAAHDVLPSVAGQQVYFKKILSGTLTLGSTGDGNAFGVSSSQPVISGNGNFVAFVSADARFGTSVRSPQVFRRNQTTGEVDLVSAAVVSGNAVPANGPVYSPAISSTGRYVAFVSEATNLASGVSGTQVYLKDMSTGALVLISQSTAGAAGNAISGSPSVSSDGTKVLFASISSNLVNTGGMFVIFMSRVYLRSVDTSTTTLASATAAGAASVGMCDHPSLSDAGNRAAFVCLGAANMLPPGMSSNGFKQAFGKALDTGAVTLISSTEGFSPTQGSGDTYDVKISANGTAYALLSRAPEFESANSHDQIYFKQAGVAPVLASRSGASGAASDQDCVSPMISASGDTILFLSTASNLVSGVTGSQIYRRKVSAGTLALVSGAPGAAGNSPSALGNVAGAGDKAVFSSSSTNLVGGANGSQIYLSVP